MFRIWYWAMIDRKSDGQFVAVVPDLGDLAAYGDNEKNAVANAAQLAAEHVGALVESGQSIPRARPASQMPAIPQANKIGRAMISVRVERTAAMPTPLASARAF
jgi:predicted RNase H-like HicB family nuclease